MKQVFAELAKPINEALNDALKNAEIQGYVIDNKKRADGTRPYPHSRHATAYQFTAKVLSAGVYGSNPASAATKLLDALEQAVNNTNSVSMPSKLDVAKARNAISGLANKSAKVSTSSSQTCEHG